MSDFLGSIKTGITIQNTTPEPEVKSMEFTEPDPAAGVSSISDSLLPAADFQSSFFSGDLHADQDVTFQAMLDQQIRASVSTLLQRTLSTGSGDDVVQITMGDDHLVHVNVNGNDEWSGTVEQFHRLTIDTGGGNDSVTNNVDDAKIFTGSGNDTVVNRSSGSLIDTGDGDDVVKTDGDSNSISTGRGDDTVNSEGYYNAIVTGSGGDVVTSKGDLNSIRTEDGIDFVKSTGEQNTIDTGRGDDSIQSEGDGNRIYAGNDADTVFATGDRNYIDSGFGTDNVTQSGNDNFVIDPEVLKSLWELLNH